MMGVVIEPSKPLTSGLSSQAYFARGPTFPEECDREKYSIASFLVTMLLNATWGSFPCRMASAEIRLRWRLFAGKKVGVCLASKGRGEMAGKSVRGVVNVSNCPSVGALRMRKLGNILGSGMLSQSRNVAGIEAWS